MNYESMSIAELEKHNNDLRGQRDKIRQEQLKVQAVISQRELENEAVRQLGKLGKERIQGITQVIAKVGGIQSLEKIGDVGPK